MPKAPAFLFYSQDFLFGVLTLSTEQTGAYVRLLCYQWIAGGVPDCDKKRARIVNESRSKTRRIWTEIRSKFVQDSDGLWRNPRLEEVRHKQLQNSDLQAQKGRRGGRAKKSRGFRSASRRLKPGASISISSSFSSSVQRKSGAARRDSSLHPLTPEHGADHGVAPVAAPEPCVEPAGPAPDVAFVAAGDTAAERLAALEHLRMLKADLGSPPIDMHPRARARRGSRDA